MIKEYKLDKKNYLYKHKHKPNSKPFNSKPINSKPFNSKAFNSKPFNSKPINSKPINSKPFNSKQTKYNINIAYNVKKHNISSANKTKTKTKKNTQYGGNHCNLTKDNFEVTTLASLNPNKFNISKYINANIDWGSMPGPPPTDCCIM